MIVIDTIVNEVETYVNEAREISIKYKLPEVCTEVLLYAMLDNKNLSVYQQLKELGVNTIGMKIDLAKKINAKAAPVSAPIMAHSNALTGLLFLNGGHTNGTRLLQTILINQNTAAARMLNANLVKLDKYGKVIYTPENN
ncbi:hypothetical protein [Mucilaginibacter sp.]|uniref:hypothetical protein n=1 Tax=Mucilaginibacter sp. TaxID=1882438 RepID=UPI0025D85BF4|nr:hypothetical protein [Mucilaginibacter sp.]